MVKVNDRGVLSDDNGVRVETRLVDGREVKTLDYRGAKRLTATEQRDLEQRIARAHAAGDDALLRELQAEYRARARLARPAAIPREEQH